MTKAMDDRYAFARKTAREAGILASGYFARISELTVERKGVQDLVSNADRDVEMFIRDAIGAAFPEDGIVGEEYGAVTGTSGYVWVIDPIDGTANFLTSIPQWCVILACVHDDRTVIGAIHEPGADELFSAAEGRGADLNGRPMQVSSTTGLHDGNLGVGMSGRTDANALTRFINDLASRGGLFFRNASGGLMLSYVASGRLIGYAEPHMHAWDCLAGQLLIAEAGGRTETQSANTMIASGGRMIASCPAIFEELIAMADNAFQNH